LQLATTSPTSQFSQQCIHNVNSSYSLTLLSSFLFYLAVDDVMWTSFSRYHILLLLVSFSRNAIDDSPPKKRKPKNFFGIFANSKNLLNFTNSKAENDKFLNYALQIFYFIFPKFLGRRYAVV